MTMTDTLVFITLCLIPISLMAVLIILLRRDAKAYEKALKTYLGECVDDGYNRARAKNARSLQSYRSRELSPKESVAPKK